MVVVVTCKKQEKSGMVIRMTNGEHVQEKAL